MRSCLVLKYGVRYPLNILKTVEERDIKFEQEGYIDLGLPALIMLDDKGANLVWSMKSLHRLSPMVGDLKLKLPKLM